MQQKGEDGGKYWLSKQNSYLNTILRTWCNRKVNTEVNIG